MTKQEILDYLDNVLHPIVSPDNWNVYSELRDMIEELPSAEPVRHGMFVGTEYDGYADGNPVYYEWKCSECGAIFEEDEPTYRYCPNCGARMDEDD